MNREDVIRWAREAGFEELFKDSHDWVCFTEEIERFAALVAAAAVRETSAEYRMGWNDGQINEREACAKVCDALHYEVDAYGAQCAAAIRARGQA